MNLWIIEPTQISNLLAELDYIKVVLCLHIHPMILQMGPTRTVAILSRIEVQQSTNQPIWTVMFVVCIMFIICEDFNGWLSQPL